MIAKNQNQTRSSVRIAPRVSLSSRWTQKPSKPKLVSFSWAGVEPRNSQR